jgi:phospholipase/lecithinase/hemolysin
MAIIHWKHGISGTFETAFDWSSNTVPGVNDNVAVNAPGTYTVTATKSHTIKTLVTSKTVTLDVTSGTFAITGGTANAGTITIGNGAAVETGGTLDNTGRIDIDSTGRATGLIVAGHVTLSGRGQVVLSDNTHNEIAGVPPRFPFFFPTATLTNLNNTITGAGSIGANLTLINDGRIIGDGKTAALTVNTASRHVSNSGLMEGTTAEGLVIVSSVNNAGALEALGTDARLVLDGTVANTSHGSVTASGTAAHVDLSSATIEGGALHVGTSDLVQSLGNTGESLISGVNVSGLGTLQANHDSRLDISGSTVGIGLTLATSGHGSVVTIDGSVGALNGLIGGGLMEFKGASAANVSFTAGQVGTLKLDSFFTGTVSGFGGHQPLAVSNVFAFGDSTVDSGALQFLSSFLPSPPNPGLTTRLQHALAAGGTNSPVGVGLMNSQLLAQDFGLQADTAYTIGGGTGGGTDYGIGGAFNAADAGSGNDPGNGSVSNINQANKPTPPDPHLLSTVDQLKSYLASNGGVADPSALFLISSGGNDVSYARNFISDPTQQDAYLSAAAQALASEIEALAQAGAQHIIVDSGQGNNSFAIFYTQQLFADLDASGITYTKSDTHALVQDVINDPTAYGFTATTVHPGVVGLNTESALIEPDTTHGLSGWGLWGANTTTPDPIGATNQQYAYLASADAEQTHFFSDDQHLSAAGQQIEANLDFNLISDDAIDLTSLPYMFGQTKASFAGDTVGGILSVSNGSQNFNVNLLGDYTNSSFMTASDGSGGTLVLNQTNLSPPQLLLAAGSAG